MKNTNYKLIIVNGLPGSDKHDLINDLSIWFSTLNYNVFSYNVLRPFSWDFSNTIVKEKGLNHPTEWVNIDILAYAVAIDNIQTASSEINSYLFDKNVFILDKYSYYWCALCVANGAKNLDVLADVYGLMIKPDINIYLEISPEEAMINVKKKDDFSDFFEINESFLNFGEYFHEMYKAYKVTFGLLDSNYIEIKNKTDKKVIFESVKYHL
ncbi:MAG: hypothetical protein FWD82_00985 [Defluviitaleaceae bacterium]|nr:hypothetical protein [Defluviitaleaceae bacterium]